MIIHEFGGQNEKKLLFFPGSCEPWQEFAYAARELAARFHVLLVTPDMETVCLLSKKNAKPKDCVEISVDAEDYYRIKSSEKDI